MVEEGDTVMAELVGRVLPWDGSGRELSMAEVWSAAVATDSVPATHCQEGPHSCAQASELGIHVVARLPTR